MEVTSANLWKEASTMGASPSHPLASSSEGENHRVKLDDDLQRSNEWRESLNPRGNRNCFKLLKIGVCANLRRSAEETYIPPFYEGSTACVVIIRGNQIIVGNVGDSRCVLSKNGQ
ncbi:hypothetical protein E2562_018788, partial [Oryza meyeriana var. granulata]